MTDSQPHLRHSGVHSWHEALSWGFWEFSSHCRLALHWAIFHKVSSLPTRGFFIKSARIWSCKANILQSVPLLKFNYWSSTIRHIHAQTYLVPKEKSFSQENIPNFLPFSSLSYLREILFSFLSYFPPRTHCSQTPAWRLPLFFILEILLGPFSFSYLQVSFINLKHLPSPSWILVLYAIYSAIFLQYSQSCSCWNCLSQFLPFLSYWCSITCLPHLLTNFSSIISTAVVFDLLPFSTYIFFPGKHTWSNSKPPSLHGQLRDTLACFYLCRI